MTSIDTNLGTETVVSAREAWVKPEIASFEPVAATEAATSQLGDLLSSNS